MFSPLGPNLVNMLYKTLLLHVWLRYFLFVPAASRHQLQTCILNCLLPKHNCPIFFYLGQIESGVISSLQQQHKHPLHATALTVCHMTDSWESFFSSLCFPKWVHICNIYASEAESCQLFSHYLFSSATCQLFTLLEMHYLSQNFHFRAEVGAINGAIFDHMNKERRTSGPICIHTCPKFAFSL